MIQMPRRSVTRFFIPLIDVMTLLFAVFLLLPIFRDSEPESPDKEKAAKAKELTNLKKELERLQAELERLRKQQGTPLQQRLAIRVLEIDPNDGRLFYYEAGRPPRKRYLTNAEEASGLILRNQRELVERAKADQPRPELHYLFVFPREDSAFPSGLQVMQYEKWFGNVSHSIDRPGGP